MKIYNYKNFILEYKYRGKASHIIEDFADLYIDRISKKFNTSVVKKLGMGAFGIAYLTRNNKVIKVTTDRNEAKNVLALKDKKFDHFLNYYDVFEMTLDGKRFPSVDPLMVGKDKTTLYFILMDYVKPLSGHKKELWSNFDDEFFDNYLDNDEFMDIVEEEVDVDYIDNSDRIISYFNKVTKQQRSSIFKEAEMLDISFSEVHPGNLGEKKDGTLVYFDIGFGDSRVIDADTGEEPSLEDIPKVDLENDFSKIKNMIISNYEKGTKTPIKKVISDISKLLNVNRVKAYKYLRDEVWTYKNLTSFEGKPIYFQYSNDDDEDSADEKSSVIEKWWKLRTKENGGEIYLIWKDRYKDVTI